MEEERGAISAEYAILLIFIVMVIVVAVLALGEQVKFVLCKAAEIFGLVC